MEKTVSNYARIFDETCPNWSNDHYKNLMFLGQMQHLVNDHLELEGIVFLNDVYKCLGFPRTQEGQIVGWHYDPENPIGDNFIDFDITDNGNNTFILDFNVDGKVIQYLPENGHQ